MSIRLHILTAGEEQELQGSHVWMGKHSCQKRVLTPVCMCTFQLPSPNAVICNENNPLMLDLRSSLSQHVCFSSSLTSQLMQLGCGEVHRSAFALLVRVKSADTGRRKSFLAPLLMLILVQTALVVSLLTPNTVHPCHLSVYIIIQHGLFKFLSLVEGVNGGGQSALGEHVSGFT